MKGYKDYLKKQEEEKEKEKDLKILSNTSAAEGSEPIIIYKQPTIITETRKIGRTILEVILVILLLAGIVIGSIFFLKRSGMINVDLSGFTESLKFEYSEEALSDDKN